LTQPQPHRRGNFPTAAAVVPPIQFKRHGGLPDALAGMRRPFLRHSLVITGLGWLLGATPSLAANVVQVRVGNHPTFTRVVFQLDAPAGYRIEKGVDQNVKELIVTLEAASTPRSVRSGSPEVGLVSVQDGPVSTVAHIRLRRGNAGVKEMILNDPPRIVIDLMREPSLIAAEKTAAREAAAPKAAAAEPAPAKVPEAKVAEVKPPEPAAAPKPAPKAAPVPVAPKLEAKPAPLPVMPKPEPKLAQAPVAPKPEAKPAEVPVAPKPEAKLAGVPVAPKPEAKLAVVPVAPKPEPKLPVAPVAPKPETGLAETPDALRPQAKAAPTPPPLGPEPRAPSGAPTPDVKPAMPAPPEIAEVAPPQIPVPGPVAERPVPGPAPGATAKARTAEPAPAASGLGLEPMQIAAFAGGVLLLVLLVVLLLRRRSLPNDLDVTALVDEDEVPAPITEGLDFGAGERVAAPAQPRHAAPPRQAPATRVAAPAGLFADTDPDLFDTSEKGESKMSQDSLDLPISRSGRPVATQVTTASAGDSDVGRLVRELERRVAQLETRLDEANEARERLERQVAAQSEELRVQRAAIARTQRALRGLNRGEEEQATEPALRDPNRPMGGN